MEIICLLLFSFTVFSAICHLSAEDKHEKIIFLGKKAKFLGIKEQYHNPKTDKQIRRNYEQTMCPCILG